MPEQEKPRPEDAATRQAEEREDLIAAYLGGGMSPEMAAAFERCMADDLGLAAEVEATRETLAAAREWLAADPPGLARADKVEVPILARRSGAAARESGAVGETAANALEAVVEAEEIMEATAVVTATRQMEGEGEKERGTGFQPVIQGQDADATATHGQDAHATPLATGRDKKPAAAVAQASPPEANVISAMEAAAGRKAAPRRFRGWQAAAAALVFGVGVLVGRSPELAGGGDRASVSIKTANPSAGRMRAPEFDRTGENESGERAEEAVAPVERIEPSERATPPAPKGKRLAGRPGQPEIRTTVEKDGRIVIETTLRGNGAPATWVVDGEFRLAQAGETTGGEE